MEYKIHLTDEAKLNIYNASEYYFIISSKLKDRFISNLIKTIDSIQENPLHYQIKYRNIRVSNLKKFPFGIHFIIENELITIIKILHHKQFYK